MFKASIAVTFVVLLVGDNVSQLRADEVTFSPVDQPASCGDAEPHCMAAPCACRHGFLSRLRDRFRRCPNCCSADQTCRSSACEQCACEPQCRHGLLEKLHLRRPSRCICGDETLAFNAFPQQPAPSSVTQEGAETEPETPRTQPAEATGARITAVPNPVAIQSDRGMITLSWNTGDGSIGQVYVSQDGGQEQLVKEGAEGSGDINWIQPGSVYEFRLYAGREHKQNLAIVTVRAVRTQK